MEEEKREDLTEEAGVEGEETEGAPAPADELSRLAGELEAKTREAEDFRDKFLRKSADLENFRKRSEKEREEVLNYANERLIRDLLSVIDNLERALNHFDEEGEKGEEAVAALRDGVELTLKEMSSVLGRFGLEEIDSTGEKFDPNLHEAMSHEESADLPSDTVIREFQKGYMLRTRLLRPSLVAVAKEPSGESGGEEGREEEEKKEEGGEESP